MSSAVPKNTNVRFSSDVFGQLSSMQQDWHARKHALQTWYVAGVSGGTLNPTHSPYFVAFMSIIEQSKLEHEHCKHIHLIYDLPPESHHIKHVQK